MGQASGEPTSDDHLVGSSDWVRARLARRCPEWTKRVRIAFDDVVISARIVIDSLRREAGPAANAVMGLFAQAISDYIDLVVDAASGRGRPAVRSARSLFEAHVGVLDCLNDDESAERWLSTAATADALLGDLKLPERHLRGKAVKAYRHRVSVSAKSANRALAAAEKTWGRKLRDHWHRDNLRQRARSHGLDDEYEFFRFASAPTHVSGGGSFGLLRIRKDGGPTVRTGSAIELVPLAILYGTDSMRGIFRAVEASVPGGLSRVLRSLDRLDDHWEDLYTAIRAVDADAWPTTEPVNRAALIVIEPNGDRSCFEYLPELHRSRPMTAEELRIDDRQCRAVNTIDLHLANSAHGRVGVFVHEATPMEPPEDAPWSDRDFKLDEEVHVLTDGCVGLTLERLGVD